MIEEWNADTGGQVMAAVRADLEEARRRCWGNFDVVQGYLSHLYQERVAVFPRPEQAQVNHQVPELGTPSIESPYANQQFASNDGSLETRTSPLDLNWAGMESNYEEFDISNDNSLSESMGQCAPPIAAPQTDSNYGTSAALDELEMSCRALINSLSPVPGSIEMETRELDDFENRYMEGNVSSAFDISSSSVMECASVSDTFQQDADFDPITALDELERSCREILGPLSPPPDMDVAPMQDLSIDMSVKQTTATEIQERPRDFLDELFDDLPSSSSSQNPPGTPALRSSGSLSSTAASDELEASCRGLNGSPCSPVPDAVTASIPKSQAGRNAGCTAVSDEHHIEHDTFVNCPRAFLDALFKDPPGELERTYRGLFEETPSWLEDVRRELTQITENTEPPRTDLDLLLTIAPAAAIFAPASSTSPTPEDTTTGEDEVIEDVEDSEAEMEMRSRSIMKSASEIPKRHFHCLWGDPSEKPCGQLIGAHWSNEDFLIHLELFHHCAFMGGRKSAAKACQWRLEDGRMCGASLVGDRAWWNLWKLHIQKRQKHAWVLSEQDVAAFHEPADTRPAVFSPWDLL